MRERLLPAPTAAAPAATCRLSVHPHAAQGECPSAQSVWRIRRATQGAFCIESLRLWARRLSCWRSMLRRLFVRARRAPSAAHTTAATACARLPRASTARWCALPASARHAPSAAGLHTEVSSVGRGRACSGHYCRKQPHPSVPHCASPSVPRCASRNAQLSAQRQLLPSLLLPECRHLLAGDAQGAPGG